MICFMYHLYRKCSVVLVRPAFLLLSPYFEKLVVFLLMMIIKDLYFLFLFFSFFFFFSKRFGWCLIMLFSVLVSLKIRFG